MFCTHGAPDGFATTDVDCFCTKHNACFLKYKEGTVKLLKKNLCVLCRARSKEEAARQRAEEKRQRDDALLPKSFSKIAGGVLKEHTELEPEIMVSVVAAATKYERGILFDRLLKGVSCSCRNAFHCHKYLCNPFGEDGPLTDEPGPHDEAVDAASEDPELAVCMFVQRAISDLQSTFDAFQAWRLDYMVPKYFPTSVCGETKRQKIGDVAVDSR